VTVPQVSEYEFVRANLLASGEVSADTLAAIRTQFAILDQVRPHSAAASSHHPGPGVLRHPAAARRPHARTPMPSRTRTHTRTHTHARTHTDHAEGGDGSTGTASSHSTLTVPLP
jgi:hypothetical protein